MLKYLVSYATNNFRSSQKILARSAVEFDIDVIYSYSRSHLVATEFYKNKREILDASRGAGYWLWKPFFILSTFEKLDEGDLLVYSDAGMAFVADPAPLLELCIKKGGILLFHAHYDDYGAPGPCINSRWTKRDCFALMNCDQPVYWSARHLDASFQIYQKNEMTGKFLKEYLLACSDPHILTDSPNISGLDNLPDFITHREDQSVLSLLAVKHSLEVFRHPSQYGNYLKMPKFRVSGEPINKPYSSEPYKNSPYPTILNHHRTKISNSRSGTT